MGRAGHIVTAPLLRQLLLHGDCIVRGQGNAGVMGGGTKARVRRPASGCSGQVAAGCCLCRGIVVEDHHARSAVEAEELLPAWYRGGPKIGMRRGEGLLLERHRHRGRG